MTDSPAFWMNSKTAVLSGEAGGRKRASSYKIPFIPNSKMPTKLQQKGRKSLRMRHGTGKTRATAVGGNP